MRNSTGDSDKVRDCPSEDNNVKRHVSVHQLHTKLINWLTALRRMDQNNEDIKTIQEVYYKNVEIIEMRRFEVTVLRTMFVNINVIEANKIFDKHRRLLFAFIKWKLHSVCRSLMDKLRGP